MTHSEVINGLSMDMAMESGDFDKLEFYKKYITRALVIGIDHFYSDMTEVIAMDKKGNEVGRYKSTQDASEKLGLDRRDLSRVVAGTRHSVKGYLFRAANDSDTLPMKKSA